MDFKDKLTQLIPVKQQLQKVTPNGLPETKYNDELSDFDHHMCLIIENADDGFIFLIDTFGGKRMYYYYILPNFNIAPLIEKAKHKFKTDLGHYHKRIRIGVF